MVVEKLCLAFHQRLADGEVDVRLTSIAVPFRSLVFKDRVVAKSIPSELGYVAMILVRIVTPVTQDHIGRSASSQRLEPNLDVDSQIGKEPILERCQIDDSLVRICQKLLGGCVGL